MNKKSIGVIGGGSWGTAIVKMLCENTNNTYWWIRNKTILDHIKSHGHNPKYVSDAKINISKVNLTNDINECVENSDIIILAIPSLYLDQALRKITSPINKKIIFSAIKGIVPETNSIVGDYINNKFNVDYENIGVITGPCHAEEVALERLSYLTVSCSNLDHSLLLAKSLSSRYIKTMISDDIFGTEYAAVLKNVIAIASGISHGLGYGDNYQAVLVSNAIREISRFVDVAHPIKRDINESAYLGDLLVTAYSQFSRNRTFGEMIARGYSVKSTLLEIKMIAEGYYAVKCIHLLNEKHNVFMPINNAVYNILYNGISAKKEMEKLSNILN
ncbi:MAG: glycerol-3-phosphate dehydrogenase [Flavobacteriales bacterium]|nr:glycerol-3-phosphate dehydrogenase [Flavobacteriales bacterium]|tara:strand:- start:2062 stop:3054 length:993 start_codon:yes stop_codon:yes gene_type:complete